ncbi:MAG: hypothetical protein NT108_01520 [Candidatus Kaiserbacteria bacterium]|nr:hypothetical protein [Candidatus Kaiserbacteria bacterium]
MSFLTGLFREEKKTESTLLIDIGATSVAGAYARYIEGELPIILYTRRLPVEVREHESREKAMLRALQILCTTLIREGAPVLMRATGSGSADMILVSLGAPWQNTSSRTEHFEQETSFTFTKSLVTDTLEKIKAATPEKLLADESVIGTILNGYETRDPYGMSVHRADIIILTSLVSKQVAHEVTAILRSMYHMKNIRMIAGGSLRYQAMRKAFPHEHDALILDATGPTTSLALIRKGLFVSILDVQSSETVASWVLHVRSELAEMGKQYPLPRTILLLAHESDTASLRDALEAANLGTLWLSDNPLKIVSVLASHIVGLVRQGTTSLDLRILLMAIFQQHHFIKEKGSSLH